MSRRRTGTIVRTRDGRWQPMVRLADGTKKRFPPLAAGTTEAKARETAAHYQEEADRLGLSRPTPIQYIQEIADCEAWVNRWHAGRAQLTSARVAKGHWKVYLRPVLGSKHPKNWTRDDYRHVSKCLDDKVNAGEMSWKTAQNVWGTATKMANDAVESKDDAVRCRDDNPANNVKGPETGERVELQYLFPAEFAKVISCKDVPIEWRLVIAIATYLYVRVGELRAMTWNDVHIDKGFVSVTKAIDATTRTLKTTKTKCPRKVPIEPELLPLLRVMKQDSGGKGYVLKFPTILHQAEGFRTQLRAAGISRAGLFDTGPSVRMIRFQDLRATGITWRAVRGDNQVQIQRHAGHSVFSTTEKYIREADDIRAGFGTPFPKLPASLLRGIGTRIGSQLPKVFKNIGDFVGAAGFEPATSSV